MRFGGTVPKGLPLLDSLPKSQQQARKSAEIRECYDELNNLVGPWGAMERDLRVLDNGTRSLFSYKASVSDSCTYPQC